MWKKFFYLSLTHSHYYGYRILLNLSLLQSSLKAAKLLTWAGNLQHNFKFWSDTKLKLCMSYKQDNRNYNVNLVDPTSNKGYLHLIEKCLLIQHEIQNLFHSSNKMNIIFWMFTYTTKG